MSQPATRLALALVLVGLAGCGADAKTDIDPTPKKLDGTESNKFAPHEPLEAQRQP